MSHKLRQLVTTLAVMLSLGTVPLAANASSYHAAHVTRKITVYRFISGKSFATSRLGKKLSLHKGQKIHVQAFYHMGKDGYMLHVNGHGKTLYYARTNSSKWFKR
ncbi:hypothetical protein [Lactiplantibacillus fabifermentans]|uniref:Extracellular protein n=2 Tax=Lactiplantibacillus fabifermentans TaxID=483011 RepID=A0A0R2NP59_9LACO|nr:hypothetical protein [Lactiplantibacillus fabifermentans]ETY73573.1 hypothetical protein LFAB_11805 [Lactiplantibacillus fabifermentans T30PCM01]KRO27445.1 hypothetical protein DY78_GL003192 [Lactiplantibacillus fabifermentans DSM 21115]